MTEFEERLTHEFSTLAAQYAQEQKRLSGQVARLEEQVRDLAAHYEQARQQYATWGDPGRRVSQGPPEDGDPRHDLDRRLRNTDRRVQQFTDRVQQARGGFNRIVAVTHAEAEQKRTQPEGLPDRVEVALRV